MPKALVNYSSFNAPTPFLDVSKEIYGFWDNLKILIVFHHSRLIVNEVLAFIKQLKNHFRKGMIIANNMSEYSPWAWQSLKIYCNA